MKIFYSIIADPAAIRSKQNIKIEELQLPRYALATLLTTLKTSTTSLPASAQHHQTWTVGLLPR